MKPSIYATDGVDTHEGDSFSSYAGKVCKGTFNNSPFVEVFDFAPGGFRGPRAYGFKNLPPNHFFDLAPDGIGTKVVVVDAAGEHYHACRDVLAMTMADITRWGGKPLIFVNVLDVATLDKTGTKTNMAFRRMMDGLASAAHELQIVCFRGETAELGLCVGSENPDALTKFNWAGVAQGVYLPDRVITGDTLAPGQSVVALYEDGFRSNGISSVRAALRLRFGEEWWKNPEARSYLQQASIPSRLFDTFLTAMNGWTNPISPPKFKMHAIIHVSGGGIRDKFGEDILFPRGLSAELMTLSPVSCIVRDVVKWRDMSEEEAYGTFNCNNGMLVVLDPEAVDTFCHQAMMWGHSAQHCGQITETGRSGPYLALASGFSGKLIVFEPKKG